VKKKVLALICGVVVCTTACGSTTNQNDKVVDTIVPANEVLSEAIEELSTEEFTEEETTEITEVIEGTEPVDWRDENYIIVNGQEITLPATIAEFNAVGYDFADIQYLDNTELVPANNLVTYNLINEENEHIFVSYVNTTDEDIPIVDAMISIVGVNAPNADLSVNVGHLNFDMSVEDVEMLYGEPTDYYVAPDNDKYVQLTYGISEWLSNQLTITFYNGSISEIELEYYTLE
jgi:hypothetical protein